MGLLADHLPVSFFPDNFKFLFNLAVPSGHVLVFVAASKPVLEICGLRALPDISVAAQHLSFAVQCALKVFGGETA